MISDGYVIRTDNLAKSFKKARVLKDLCLDVPKGSIFGFLGPNGAGKTTTMKLLLGLIKPTDGTGTIFGMDIVKESISIRSRIGYLSQDPRFYNHLSARENLRFVAGFFYKGLKNDLDKLIDESLSLVALSDKADRPIKGFSGGELQRLGIAQAQLNSPDLLILDEPMASLDPIGRKEILEVMENLQGRTTVFYSTHILSDVQRISDTVAILNHGRLVTCGRIKEILAGQDGIVYEAMIKGNVESVSSQLSQQKWITGVEENKQKDVTLLTINVTDKPTAENKLLRLLLLDESTVVTEFRRKKYELEDAFMDIIGRGENNEN